MTLDELAAMPQQKLSLPVSAHPKIRAMADALVSHPEDRSTFNAWAKRLALSERSLARLMLRETGLTFGAAAFDYCPAGAGKRGIGAKRGG